MNRRTSRAHAVGVVALVLLAGAACRVPPRSASGPSAPAAAAVVPAPRTELSGPVESIELVGLSADRAAAARSGLTSAVGVAFDREQVASDVRAIWALGGVADVAVEGRPTATGVDLRFRVREQPRIRTIGASGPTALASVVWRPQLAQFEGKPLDPADMVELRRFIVDDLQARGYLAPTVRWQADTLPEGQVDVRFTVEPGPPVKLARLEFRGSRRVPQQALRDIVASAGGNAIGRPYSRAGLEGVLPQLASHYFELGFVLATIGTPEETLSADGTAMSVVVPVFEGDEFRIGDVTVRGALIAPERQYLELLRLRRDRTFRLAEVRAAIDRLHAFHRERGAPARTIDPATTLDRERKRVHLELVLAAPESP